MFELKINGNAYQFNFGFGFMREINKRITKPIEGVKGQEENVGLQYRIAGIIDGDLEALIDVLVTANKGFDPRLTQEALENHLENDDTDIEEVFDKVLGFLKTANCTKKKTLQLIEYVEQKKAEQAAEK
jgi:hypothetical protein